MSPAQKKKKIKSKAAKEKYKITEAARKERIEVRRRGLRLEHCQLKKDYADIAIDHLVQEMSNNDIRKIIELKEKELQRLRLQE